MKELKEVQNLRTISETDRSRLYLGKLKGKLISLSKKTRQGICPVFIMKWKFPLVF
jgi:hypothetical protein